MIIKFPYKMDLRHYQKELWNAFFDGRYKRFINVWHRRAGKDSTWLQIMVAATQERVGNYIYSFPEYKAVRRAIWEGINKDGVRFLDLIPDEICADKRNIDMTVIFKNGSTLQFTGSDRYNQFRGSNAIGVIFSEYPWQNPLAWSAVVNPMLMENGGWASFVFTPDGKNHAYNLYNKNKKNPSWFCSLYTVDDTCRNDGTPVVSVDTVNEARMEGMIEDLIQQEFYCSFNAASSGAYFSEEIARAHKYERIKEFQISPSSRVYTSWDIGVGDATSIWFFQNVNNVPHAIYYYENSGKNIQHYVTFLNEFRNRNNIVYDTHYIPHDGKHRDRQTAKTYEDALRELCSDKIVVVKRCSKKQIAIEAGRQFMSKVVFHKANCEYGLSCLSSYQSKYDDKNLVKQLVPIHNWASHGADAFMTYSQYESSHPEVNTIDMHRAVRWSSKYTL